MKKVIQFTGNIFIGIAIVFLLVHSFLAISDGSITKDVFGFTIPEPPLWTSYIPILGSIIGFFVQFFSIHGLIGIVISLILLGIGVSLINFGKSK